MLNGEPIAKAIEHMTVDAMLAAEPYLKIASSINDPKKYLGLTDDIKTEIQRSQAPVSTHILQVHTVQTITCRSRNSWRHRRFLNAYRTGIFTVALITKSLTGNTASYLRRM
jgi:hypothetical protein